MGSGAGPVPDVTSATLYFGPWYRKSPFFEATLRWGCTAYDVYNHMYLPAYYDELVAEYWALVNDVTLWDVAVERVVQISGPDGFTLANMLTCRDLTRCAAGQGKYAPVIAPDGGIINDPVLLRRDCRSGRSAPSQHRAVSLTFRTEGRPSRRAGQCSSRW